MQTALRVINTITAFGAVLLILVSLWPGYIADACFLLIALPCTFLLGLAWLIVSSRRLPRPWGRSTPLPVRRILVAPILVLTTLVLLQFYIPRRIAFVTFSSKFDQLLPTAPVSAYDGAELNRWLGIYHVDRYATDPRGGTYFRTGTTMDMINRLSHGFAHNPNPHGTPFGAAHYKTRHVIGNWYWFSASDDWF